MFDKILIANRGEIACRVIETAKRLGVATVAVYSEADAQARHVALADEAVAIGGPAPKDSYLRGAAIIAAALESGAQAIHPGYGFLSENPDFVEAVEAAGLTFIGPSARAIWAMGLKDAAKALMEEAGVPVVPGYRGADQDPARLEAAAGEIGYPVLIKAVAGGGGKGMRLVERPEAFADHLASAQAEAESAFGNSAVLIEKFISNPRHIEMQVFGDGTTAVHLFERDCSLQRRHQKVIEEAPAPGMTPQMRAAMGQAATRAAQAIGYAGAGTVEFIVDGTDGLRPDRFWFMEMNTRLQVEHPVTEAITGVDLVEWQLRVAAGEGLPLAQDQLAISGHAFEARLYAEDVPAGFLPATGTLSHLVFAPGCRADTGVRTGDVISPFYDPMIAKIITHGPSRAVALGQLARALETTQVAGTVTNLAFLARLARHPGFARGQVDTGLIGREIEALSAPLATPPAAQALAVIAASGLWEGAADGFALWTPLRRPVDLFDQAALTVRGPDEITVEIAGQRYDCVRHPDGWRVEGAKTGAAMHLAPGHVTIFMGGGAHSFEIPDPFARGAAAESSDLTLAPMPGLVRQVFVREGQSVRAGDRLAIMEAMKMEHTLCATRDGVIAEVLAREGAQVEAGAALIRLEEDT
ncbi:3-methylcrotonyl-CoA carboxylase [Thioclava dalianensis]|uniref:3-methylcrotonyl-CoA carboxylase n=1 Tax=Thioclava dalianensis TaxID=1185766 RepID=A0A074THA8_9RHOB|nr:acetyl/propionyl/methylcrotonyl-CoA carboxylase subunit alpha [Thioclava dalianensis]KEP71054.1 3-methylcrotonyl-CoA carboxylase [Thioclava dalianensis]SFN25938.1 3-methylcrotonyl-CoA carboxylase alpha subunit [Thioclava dalianensis]